MIPPDAAGLLLGAVAVGCLLALGAWIGQEEVDREQVCPSRRARGGLTWD